jgi:Short C-terminal domain
VPWPGRPAARRQALAAAAGGKSIEQRLAGLEDLRNRGVITDEEFTAARAKVIGSA